MSWGSIFSPAYHGPMLAGIGLAVISAFDGVRRVKSSRPLRSYSEALALRYNNAADCHSNRGPDTTSTVLFFLQIRIRSTHLCTTGAPQESQHTARRLYFALFSPRRRTRSVAPRASVRRRRLAELPHLPSATQHNDLRPGWAERPHARVARSGDHQLRRQRHRPLHREQLRAPPAHVHRIRWAADRSGACCAAGGGTAPLHRERSLALLHLKRLIDCDRGDLSSSWK